MAKVQHATRRGAIYHWRRRTPKTLVGCRKRAHLILSLQTADSVLARGVAARLDARLEEILLRPDAHYLTPAQLDALLKVVVDQHAATLRVGTRAMQVDPLLPAYDPAAEVQQDLAFGWAYRLASERGPRVALTDADSARMRAEGLSDDDIYEVQTQLWYLQSRNFFSLKPNKIEPLLEAIGVEPSASRMAQAHGVYLLGIAEALFRQAKARLQPDTTVSPLLDQFLATSLAERVEAANGVIASASAPRAGVGQAEMPPPAPVASPDMSPTAPMTPDRGPDTPPQLVSSGKSIMDMGKDLARIRAKHEDWEEKTQRQALSIYDLFQRFTEEEYGYISIANVEQRHVAAFANFLSFELPVTYGRSPKDFSATIAALRMKKVKAQGLDGATLNRHLTNIGQLLDYTRSQGISLPIDVSVKGLRAKSKSDERDRDVRAKPTPDACRALFGLPPYTGCVAWDEPTEAGDVVYHRALFFAVIILVYTGARREEICGLDVADVITDNGGIPYIHIARNEHRRIKNKQSRRNLPLHPEIIRLGFLDYVDAIKALGYSRVFPDLYSPTSSSPSGDRLQDEVTPLLKGVSAAHREIVIHSLRHGFNDMLKQKEVGAEVRSDLMGHVGKSESTERYCNAFEIEILMRHVMKLPVVTDHLDQTPIRLLPWVEKRLDPPFSCPTRSGTRKRRLAD